MKVEIRPTVEGVSLAVRAQPGAKKNRVCGVHDCALKVAVTAPPEDGKANEALIRFLAESFGCKPNQVELVQGRTDRRKVFEFRGLSPSRMEQVIESLLAQLNPGN